MNLEHGRPLTCAGRLEKEIRCYDLLDNLGLSYERVDHQPADTMEICAAIDTVLGGPICKNLLLCNRQCTDFYLLLMPATKPFKTKDLSAQIGTSRLSFADGKYMEQFLDITPGSLSILGLINDLNNNVKLLIDEDILADEYIGFHPCINTSSLRITVADLQNILIPALNHTPTIVQLPQYNENRA